jgi:hypothetical protein
MEYHMEISKRKTSSVTRHENKVNLILVCIRTEAKNKYQGSVEYSAPKILALKEFDRKATMRSKVSVFLNDCMISSIQGETVKETENGAKESFISRILFQENIMHD